MTGALTQVRQALSNPLAVLIPFALLFVACSWMSSGTVQILSFVLTTSMFAFSIYVLTGLAGQMSLGHAGFFGIGAYGSAILAKDFGIDVAASVCVAAAVSTLVAYLMSFPAGRVREVYLAMMTLGFGMVFYEIVREWVAVTGGTMGFRGVPSPMLRNLVILGLPIDAVQYFRVLLVVTAGLMLLLRNLTQSRVGRAFYAVHFSEIAAGSIGISRGQTKRHAYALSGALAGLAGAFYGHLVGYLGPESFALPRSIEVLVVAIVGGLGSIPGQILSSVVFTFLPEKLQVFSEYQYIVYGIILTFSLILLPKGIAGLLLAPPRFIRDRAIAWAAGQDGGPEAGHPDGASSGTGTLRVEGVTVKFGGLTAVDNVSLDLKPGQITALIGPNGSGKSTLVNAISGIYRPVAGRIVFQGTDITGWHDHQVARRGVVRTFQDPRLVPHFTVRENLLLGAHRLLKYSGLAAAFGLRSAIAEEAKFLAGANAVLKLTDLHAVADRTIDTLPYGYCRLAEVGRALIAQPRAILLDEPAAGLSETEMERLAKVIRDMKAMGLIILLIEHHMDFVAELVDDVVVLDSGRVIYRGDVAGMRRDPQVIAAYLGSEELAHA